MSTCSLLLTRKIIAFSNRIPLAVRGGLLLLIVVAVLHTLDRQGEFVSRTDFLWKAKLKVEQEEVETMRGINKVNISISERFSSHCYSNFLRLRFCLRTFCQLTLRNIF